MNTTSENIAVTPTVNIWNRLTTTGKVLAGIGAAIIVGGVGYAAYKFASPEVAADVATSVAESADAIVG